MKKLLASILIALAATSAIAGPTCTVPKDKWMKETDLKARLEAQGYQIKTFKSRLWHDFLDARCAICRHWRRRCTVAPAK